MTPAQFHAAYRSTANQVSDYTNVDPIALLAQWACETAWGTVVIGNNLGNIRCSPTTFCQYATLDDFAISCIAVLHQSNMAGILTAKNTTDQLAAICASPWSSGHYGGSLDAFASPLEEFELTPEQDVMLRNTFNAVQSLNYAWFYGQGTPNVDPSGYASKGVDGRLAASLQPILDAIAKLPTSGGGGGTEPIEPAEPKTITLEIPSVPGTATGKIT